MLPTTRSKVEQTGPTLRGWRNLTCRWPWLGRPRNLGLLAGCLQNRTAGKRSGVRRASVGRTRYPIDLDIFNIGYRPKK